MKRSTHHVTINLDGGWSVKSGGVLRAMRRFKTEGEAKAFATGLARERHGDVYFHRRDGTVQEKVSY